MINVIAPIRRGVCDLKRARGTASVQWRGNKKHDIKPYDVTNGNSSVNVENADFDGDISYNNDDLNVDTEIVYEYKTVKSWDNVGKSMDRKYFAFVDKIFEDTEDKLTFKISDICIERIQKNSYFKYYDTKVYKTKPR